MPGRKRKNPERIRVLSDIIQTEVRRVFHCVAVTAVVQHFDIISAVPEGSALLRRNSPALCKPLQAGRLVTARNDQIIGAVTAGCGLSFPAEPPRNIQDFRVFPAQINNSINVNAGSAAGSVLLSI